MPIHFDSLLRHTPGDKITSKLLKTLWYLYAYNNFDKVNVPLASG